MRGKIERAKRAHKNFEEKRRNILVSLTEHCNQHLFNTFQVNLKNLKKKFQKIINFTLQLVFLLIGNAGQHHSFS